MPNGSRLTGPTAPQAVTHQQRVGRALELRARGATYPEIAQALDISQRHAIRLVKNALRDLAAANAHSVDHLRGESLARLGLLWREAESVLVVAKGTGNLNVGIKAISALLRIEDRRSALLGLDGPKRVEAGVEFTLDTAFALASESIEANRERREAFLVRDGHPISLIDGDLDDAVRVPDDTEDLLPAPSSPNAYDDVVAEVEGMGSRVSVELINPLRVDCDDLSE